MRHTTLALVALLAAGALAVTALAGCSSSTPNSTASAAPSATAATPSAAIGGKIFTTGIGSDGQQILTEAPPRSQGAMLLGGGGCASCHGANGHGGTIRVPTASISAPNITYAALVKAGYTDASLRASILWCTDQAGEGLNEAMPCWQMTDTDVDSTIAYIKTLR